MMAGIICEWIGVGYWRDFRMDPQNVLPERLECDIGSAEMEETGDVFGRIISLGRDSLGHTIEY